MNKSENVAFKFKLFADDTFLVSFKHYGKRKGRPPKGTICTIKFDPNGKSQFENSVSVAVPINSVWIGRSKPITEVALLCLDKDHRDEVLSAYGKAVKRSYKIYNAAKGFPAWVVITKGDNFTYARGRLEAFKNALENYNRQFPLNVRAELKRRAFKAFFDRFSTKAKKDVESDTQGAKKITVEWQKLSKIDRDVAKGATNDLQI